MIRPITTLVLSLFMATAAMAQDVSDIERRLRSLEEKIAQMSQTPDVAELRRQIEILTREIETLKTGEKAEPPRADTSQFGLGAAASKVYRAQPGVSIGGYGEWIYQNVAGSNDAGNAVSARDTTDALRAVLYTGYKFNDRILFNSEVEFEHGSTGAGGEVSVEFAYLDFLVREDMGVRAGLLLVPMGIINEQHEPTAYFGARRPLVERNIIPATWRELGAGVFGEVGRFSYRGYVVSALNSSRFTSGGIRSGRGNGAQSIAEDFALTGRLDYAPVVGTTVGAALYTGNTGHRVVAPGFGPIEGRLTMYDLHVDSKFRGVSLRGVWTRGTLDDVAAINRANNLTGAASVGESFGGWYAEAGYDVTALRPFGDASITPFVRYEKFNTQRSVPTGFSLNRALDNAITTFGIQYKPIAQTVIKLDYQNVDNEAGTGVNQWNLAVGYIF